jgi:hypothetical protein
MDNGVSFAPSFTTTHPMIPSNFVVMDPSIFYNGMQNYNAQSTPWVSSQFPIDIPPPMQPSPRPTYMNPSIGPEGTMALMRTASFDMSHVPMGGWNLPPYGSNTRYALSEASTQMGAYPTYYTPPMYLWSTMSVPSNTFSMTGPQLPLGLSYGENQFYGSGYPLYGTPSQGGNIYPHSNNLCPTPVSSQTSMTMPIQTSSNHFGMNQHLFELGKEVYQDPTWLAIFQNQYFPGPWNKMPPSIASPVIVSHTGAPSPTSTSHVGDGSTSSTNYVNILPLTSTNYVGGTVLFPPNHSLVTSLASIHHTRDDSLSPSSYIQKPRCLIRKPKLFCRTCEGGHLTRLCPIISEIP